MQTLREQRQERSTVRRERYSPLSYTRALPYPTGESFSDGCTPSSEPPSIHACYPLGNCGRTIEIKGVAGGGAQHYRGWHAFDGSGAEIFFTKKESEFEVMHVSFERRTALMMLRHCDRRPEPQFLRCMRSAYPSAFPRPARTRPESRHRVRELIKPSAKLGSHKAM